MEIDPRDYLQDRVKAAGTLFASCVRSLAVPNATGVDLIPVGSGTLVWHRGARYVVTAAHVLDLYPGHAVYIGTNSRWAEVQARFRATKPPKGMLRDDDRLDFAFAPLPEAFAQELDGCHFLQSNQSAANEHVVFTPPYRSKYTAFGFPLNRFDMSYPTKTSYPKNVAYTGAVASRSQYESLKLTVDSHVVIECDQDNVVGKAGLQMGPKLDGISGGGLFRMPSLETRGSVAPPILAGIVTEQYRKERLLVGVRLGVVFSAIDSVGGTDTA